MIDEPQISSALNGLIFTRQEGEAVVVDTPLLYPSNGVVQVYVSRAGARFTVSDNGGALATIAAHGRAPKDSGRFLRRFAQHQGLLSDNRSIATPPVDATILSTAIVLVANAAKEAAHYGVEHGVKSKVGRSIQERVDALVSGLFTPSQMKDSTKVTGRSGRAYRFAHYIILPRGKKLLLDPAVRDPNAINSRYVAHSDVARNQDNSLIQRIIFDEDDDWSSSDLLLMRSAAPVYTLASARDDLDRVRHAV